jgi:AcrR family transcriptional regulator
MHMEKSRPMQARAIRTRERILEGAARVFADVGFAEATIADVLEAAGVTKGAFYHHFDNDGAVGTKVKLAQALLDTTLTMEGVVEGECKLQWWIDTGMVIAHRLPREPALRAAVQLAMSQNSRADFGMWPQWTQVTTMQLTAARESGELLPGVNPADVSRVLVGAFPALALITNSIDGDLSTFEKESVRLYELFLPALAVPGVIPHLDFAADRGKRVWAEYLKSREE